MTLIEQIKQDQLAARKEHKALATSLLTTLIGEATAIGKNNGNRDVTDAEVVALVKKFTKGMDDTLGYLKDSNPEGSATVLAEKEILSAYLPKQLTEAELVVVVAASMERVENTTGSLMKYLKDYYPGQYDGKMASTIIKYMLT